MLDFLTVFDKHTNWSDYFWWDFVR